MMTKPLYNAMTAVAIAASLLLLGLPVLGPELANIITPFLAAPVVLEILALFAFSTVIALVTCGIGLWRRQPSGLVPLLIHGAVICLVLLVPIGDLMYELEFRMLYWARMDVVEQIEAGELQPNEACCPDLIKLPWKYRLLSRGHGEVFVDTDDEATVIFFFTYHGILDSYEGFLYRSDSAPPSPSHFGGGAQHIEKVHEHWYRVISY